MTHYVCPACGTTSEKPGACNTAGCMNLGRDLAECHCTDEQHGEVMQQIV